MSVKMRQLVEREIAVATIKALLAAGFSLGVNDGEETTIHHSTNPAAIEAAMFTTDDDRLLVYEAGSDEKDLRPDYWVWFVYGNDGWDVISDYSAYLETWIGDGTEVAKVIAKYED